VLARALVGPLTPIDWSEDDEPIVKTPPADDVEAVITH